MFSLASTYSLTCAPPYCLHVNARRSQCTSGRVGVPYRKAKRATLPAQVPLKQSHDHFTCVGKPSPDCCNCDNSNCVECTTILSCLGALRI